MKTISNSILSLALTMNALTSSVAANPIYVAPNGSDAATGTIATPFQSLERARDAVREINKEDSDITVFLRGGNYILDSTFVLGLEDGAKGSGVIRYAAYKDEVPVISSLKVLQDWQPLAKTPNSLPAVAKNEVWVAKIPADIDFKVLYYNGEMLSRARSAGFLPVESAKGKASFTQLTVPEGFDLQRWSNLDGIEMIVRPKYPWSMNILPVADVDPVSRVVTAAHGGTYPLEPPPAGFQALHELKETAWFENALNFLDEPGEWVLDSAAGLVYLWPKSSLQENTISYPQCVELVKIEGVPSGDASIDQVVRGIHFEGITFRGNDRYTWKADEPSYQHDWSAIDQPNAMLRLRSAEDCVIRNCRFIHGGTAGIRVDLQAYNHLIEGNLFQDLGEHGIALCGYGPGTKDVSQKNRVLNNRILRVGQLYWYSSGIFVSQSGHNTIANNLIHNVPYIAITLSGARDFRYGHPMHGEGHRSIRWGDISIPNRQMLLESYKKGTERTDFFLSYLHARGNIVENNEIFAAMEILGDGNAIYLSGAGTHNIVRRNFVHHILSDGIATAMRPDDLQKYTTFEKNIIYKCVYGAIEHKHQNHYLNNIFANIYPTNIYGNVWHESAYFLFGRGSVAGSRIQGNIFYSDEFEPRFYYARGKAPMDEAVIDNNLYWFAKDPSIAEAQLIKLQNEGHDQHGVVANPMFVDIKNGDFSLMPDSPAKRLGIRSIDSRDIGLSVKWQEKLVGSNLMTTRITPETHYLPDGQTITLTIESSASDAVIRYTLDGTVPNEKSPIYRGAFETKTPLILRAKSFNSDAIDLYGAFEFFAAKNR